MAKTFRQSVLELHVQSEAEKWAIIKTTNYCCFSNSPNDN